MSKPGTRSPRPTTLTKPGTFTFATPVLTGTIFAGTPSVTPFITAPPRVAPRNAPNSRTGILAPSNRTSVNLNPALLLKSGLPPPFASLREISSVSIPVPTSSFQNESSSWVSLSVVAPSPSRDVPKTRTPHSKSSSFSSSSLSLTSSLKGEERAAVRVGRGLWWWVRQLNSDNPHAPSCQSTAIFIL